MNPIALAKRRGRYAVKLAAYRRSETYRRVEERAGGRCEAMDTLVWEWSSKTGMAKEATTVEPYRCYADRRYPDGTKLTHHHLTYSRFGGKERPEDIIVLCQRHNAEAEAHLYGRTCR